MTSDELELIQKRLAAELKRVGTDRVATQIGVSRATVYNWMAGVNTPLNKLIQLVQTGVDVPYILSGLRSQPVQDQVQLAPDEAIFLENYRYCPPEVQAAIRAAAASSAGSNSAGKKRTE